VRRPDGDRPLYFTLSLSCALENRRPVVLTVNGKAELVVQDAEIYQHILDRPERLEAVEAIRLGIAAAEKGRVKPARQALAELRKKLGISG
jgi:hypothetical protein